VFDDHVAGQHAGLCRSSVGRHLLDDSAHARLQTVVFEAVARHWYHLYADATANDFTLTKLWQQFAHRINRHCESNADVPDVPASFVADDRGIDADDLTANIEQRAARVAGVDGGVGLNHLV